jgi:hypothetical protein
MHLQAEAIIPDSRMLIQDLETISLLAVSISPLKRPDQRSMAAPSFSSFPERKKSTPLPSPPPVVIRDERGERMRREDDSSSSLHLKKRAKYREVSPERESRDRKERKDSRHDEKRAERRSRKDGSRDEKRERREDPSSSKHHRSTVPTVAVPPPSSSSATKDYYLDTRGDPDILHFGSRRGYRFIPSGRGRVLGLGEEWRLDGRDAGSGRGVGVGLVGDSTVSSGLCALV